MTLRIHSTTVLAAALYLLSGSPGVAKQPAAPLPASLPAAIQLQLPAPTGHRAVGVTDLHLTDAGRPDPWVAAKPRQLMVSVWYPAVASRGVPRATYMLSGAARVFVQSLFKPMGIDPAAVDLSDLRTHAGLHAPAARQRGGFPVILYSPGGNLPRAMGTTLVEDLASRGYVVVAIDHTHEAVAVEFPSGRVETNAVPKANDALQRMQAVRIEDVQFVLDRLALMARGAPFSASQAPLPAGLRQTLDLSRVGMFGHSAGGFTALQALADDARLDAAANLDGSLAFSMSRGVFGDVVEKGLSKPFLLMGGGVSGRERKPHTHAWAPDWKRLWDRSTGFKRDMYLADAEHMSFTDQQVLLPQIAAAANIAPLIVASAVGKLNPGQSLGAQRAYLAAFFDQHLKGRPQRLLQPGASGHPAVAVIP